MPIRAVILDWDGTIYNSSNLNIAGGKIIRIVKSHGHKVPKDIYKILRKNWNLSSGELLKKCFGIELVAADKIYDEWETMEKTEFYPLIKKSKSVIRKLKARQIKVLLLTNRSRKYLDWALNNYKLAKLFDFVQARDDWSFIKPDPHAFCNVLHWLIKLGIRPHECAYVGDTILDFECTTSRTLTSVSVTTGVFSKADFFEAGQKKENILSSIADLPEWIDKYGRV